MSERTDPTGTMAPLIVSVPASSGTGSGMVTDDKRPVYIHAIEPLTMIFVRSLKSFVDAVLGSSVITTFAPNLFDVNTFTQGLKIVLLSSLAVAGITALRTISELLGKWDQKHPTMSA